MKIEEKAKRYDETLEQLRGLIEGTREDKCAIVEEDIIHIFPELKESEDERIRKEIISHLQHEYVVKKYVSDVEYDRWIAWLKKLGYKPQGKTALEVAKEENVDNANKAEPKFKVGDWITNGQLTCKVLGATSKFYSLHLYNDDYCHFETDIQSINKHYHLWSIEDAKDGDVVVDKSDGTIGIFQSIGHHPDGGSYNDLSYCFLHCRYDDGFFYADFENGNTMDSDDVIPATKEQRETLMKAMADAGWEFDFEKKRVEKD